MSPDTSKTRIAGGRTKHLSTVPENQQQEHIRQEDEEKENREGATKVTSPNGTKSLAVLTKYFAKRGGEIPEQIRRSNADPLVLKTSMRSPQHLKGQPSIKSPVSIGIDINHLRQFSSAGKPPDPRLKTEVTAPAARPQNYFLATEEGCDPRTSYDKTIGHVRRSTGKEAVVVRRTSEIPGQIRKNPTMMTCENLRTDEDLDVDVDNWVHSPQVRLHSNNGMQDAFFRTSLRFSSMRKDSINKRTKVLNSPEPEQQLIHHQVSSTSPQR